MVVVYEVDDARLHLMLGVGILHLYTILHHLCELEVALIERRTLYPVQFLDGIIYGIDRQGWVDAMQRLLQHIIQQRIAVVTHYIRPVLIAVLLTLKALK